MGDEVAKDMGGGGGARFDVNESGGGRFIDAGLFILPELDVVAGSRTGRGWRIRMKGAGTERL